MLRRLAIILLFAACFTASAVAHEVRPAFLELRQVSQDTFDVLWKVPARGEGTRLRLYVRMPADAVTVEEPRTYHSGEAHIERWQVAHPAALVGADIHIDGLSASATDVLVRIERLDGTTQTARVVPSDPMLRVEAAPDAWGVAETYFGLGVEHILLGIDHLLFVLALLFLLRGWRKLVGAITAFTVAHSITLALATLGVLYVPGPPVEACVALSIAFVAAEIIHQRRGLTPLSVRQPWIVAFAFGLLHGLGFASALTDIGLPQNHVPLALLFFNIGVEAGQLAFVAAVLPAVLVVQRGRVPLPRWTGLAVPYGVGSIAMYWMVQRVAGF